MRLAQSYFCMLLLATCGLVGLADSSKFKDASSVACPTNCRCQTTIEGLHKAICFSTEELHKYSLRNKHHNINIVDLSYSNISKLNYDLDKFTEMVSIDLSHNQIAYLNKFLLNSRKLVHVNLADNKLKSFSASALPSSVSSLDLRNNYIKNVPSDFAKMKDLEHLLLEGNPLHCSCENIKILHSLAQDKIVIDNVECVSPPTEKGKNWNKSNILKDCKKANFDDSEEMMLGDEPEHETFAPVDSSKKSMEMTTSNDRDHSEDSDLTADNSEFIFPKDYTDKSTDVNDEYMGSGDGISHEEMIQEERQSEDILPFSSTETPLYEGGSGDGSGDYFEASGDFESEENSTTIDPILPIVAIPVIPTNDDLDETTYVTPQRPSIFPGKPDWTDENIGKKIVPTQETAVESTGEENVNKTPESEDSSPVNNVVTDTAVGDNKLSEEYQEGESKTPQKTSLGTYICIGLIIAFLVGLIGITVIKGQMRKRRDRRQIRQQRADVEKAGKEMVDMNKSLLGKPAITNDSEKKINGNYELVPTHEKTKKPENGNVEKKANSVETPMNDDHDGVSLPNGNKNPSNIDSNAPLPQNNDSPPVVNITPLKSEYDPQYTGSNGYPEQDSLPYSNDHLPIIPPQESGKVKIKLTETLKPKTPILVTRSRSNAGDIIITPAADQSPIYKNPTT